ncbi:MAG: HD domain-containing protein [Clostridiales Family XIII bacterium]|jgi:(p)ppGpp synthase/HD superfamily hydrolase|nr:HD domain-containing protein [Clostridiales Family XIII bacterium]
MSIELAMQIATKAHEGQFDKGGKPYINHPIAVFEMVEGEDAKMVALLHDVIEDSETTLDDLRAAGFSENIVSAVDCLTKRDEEVYENYLVRVRKNHIARDVKRADLIHNMDTSRLTEVTEDDLKRFQKYSNAVSVLMKSI